MLQGSIMVYYNAFAKLIHQTILKISEIEAPADSSSLEAAEREEFPLNTLVSIPPIFSTLIIHLEIVLPHTSLCWFTLLSKICFFLVSRSLFSSFQIYNKYRLNTKISISIILIASNNRRILSTFPSLVQFPKHELYQTSVSGHKGNI